MMFEERGTVYMEVYKEIGTDGLEIFERVNDA